jgi:hypothetical protein
VSKQVCAGCQQPDRRGFAAGVHFAAWQSLAAISRMGTYLDKLRAQLEGPDPIEKHVLLLKLVDLFDHVPDFSGQGLMEARSPQRWWLSSVGALLDRYDSISFGAKFETTLTMMTAFPADRAKYINEIQGQVADAIARIKLQLELDGRAEIGTAYEPGDIYRYFADLKKIIGTATRDVMIIDPYFDGAAFDAYLSEIPKGVSIRILTDRYAKDVFVYAKKHAAQFGTATDIKRSDDLHDRLVIVDQDACWISGSSIKDAGKKATYLIPVVPEIAEAKRKIYAGIWAAAKLVT